MMAEIFVTFRGLFCTRIGVKVIYFYNRSSCVLKLYFLWKDKKENGEMKSGVFDHIIHRREPNILM